MHRVNHLTLALLALLFQPLAHAETANKGKQVIDQVIAALGGDRFLHMQNRVESGRIYGFFHDQLSGLDLTHNYVEYLASDSPHGLPIRERQLLGKKQDYSYLFLSDQGWDVTYRGARPVADEDWQRYVRTTRNDILFILRFRTNEPGIQFDYIGSDIYLSRHVEIVDITDSQDQTVRVYLDHNTMLPMHQTFTWIDPATRQHNDEAADYDKYRDAGGGVLWPFSIERQRNGYKVFQIFAEKVDVNQPLPARDFRPAARSQASEES